MSITEMRKQLDALMGTNRDGDDPYDRNLKNFNDRDVCKYYICGLCPHDAFTNTKKEMGPCPNLHSEPLKMQFEGLDDTQRKEHGYDRNLGKLLDDIVRECDKTIEKQEAKLKENEAEKLENDPISREISALQAQAEKLGEEGKVDEYMKVNTEIKLLEQRRLQQQVMQIPSGAAGEVIQQHGTQSQQQKLRVCEVCSCYLSKFDSDKRLADHFNGKLHMGYVAVREKLEELKTRGFYTLEDVKGPPTAIRPSRERRREEPYRDAERDRERDRDRDREQREREQRGRDRNTRRIPQKKSHSRSRSRERRRSSGDRGGGGSSSSSYRGRHSEPRRSRERDYGRGDKHKHSRRRSHRSRSRTPPRTSSASHGGNKRNRSRSPSSSSESKRR